MRRSHFRMIASAPAPHTSAASAPSGSPSALSCTVRLTWAGFKSAHRRPEDRWRARARVAILAPRRLTHVESAPLAATIESTKTCGPQQGAALMKRTTKYVAFDVHQATTVASVREESGRVIARSVLPTDRGALTEFVRGMRGARHVTFEEGTQAQWLYDLLAPLVDRVVVCDRRGASRQGNKGDQVDADQLSELLRRGALRAVYHGSADRATLKELTRTYRNLVEDATRVMLRLKALFRARAIPTRGTTVYQARARGQWLAQLADRGARFRAEALYAELDVLRKLRPKAKAAMVTEARRDPAWPVLRTIPFLGPLRVALLLATMQTPWRFRTKRHPWAYARLGLGTRPSADCTRPAR